MAAVLKVVTAMTVKMVSRSPSSDFGRMAAMAKAAEAPQIATAPPVSVPKRTCRPKIFEAPIPNRMVNTTPPPPGQQGNGIGPQAQDLLDGNAQAQQRHAEPEQGLGEKFDAGDAAAFLGKEMEGHAQEQGKQHLRRPVMLGQELRRGGDGDANQYPRTAFAPGAPVAAKPGIKGGGRRIRHGDLRRGRRTCAC